MEQAIVNWLKQHYKHKIPISQVMRELHFTRAEQLEFLGSIKLFTRLRRTYSKQGQRICSCLELVY